MSLHLPPEAFTFEAQALVPLRKVVSKAHHPADGTASRSTALTAREVARALADELCIAPACPATATSGTLPERWALDTGSGHDLALSFGCFS